LWWYTQHRQHMRDEESMTTTYTAARVYTALTDTLLQPGAVAVSDGAISYVGDPSGAPAGGERVDLGDVTLLPGLIDMHVHLTFSGSEHVLEDFMADGDELRLLRGVENARRALLAGVTTVRECGGQNTLVFALREASGRGLISAPRVIAAGGAITTTGGHCWFFGLEADGEAELRYAVRSQSKAGADYIKVMASGGGLTPRTNPVAPQYTAQEMRAIVDEATRLGLDVAAHCHGTASVAYAAAAGARTIEHCSFLTPEGLVYDEEVARAVIAAGCYVCPTIAIGERAAATLPPDHPMRLIKERTGERRIENLRRLHAAGARLISGSDAGVTLTPFEDFAYNITLLVDRVGLTPHQAIQTATLHAAEALRRDDLGALAPGRSADLLAVHGNPLDAIHALFDVALVVSRGRRVV
jgi:imidazolonepropionase-like amidohydrolase